MTDRSYGDECGAALALDVVGERWALLVVRELMFGPKRFADLSAGLPHASQNVLSQRLKELESAGVIQRVKLGPPARAQVYELTEAGVALEPAVLALARWGARLDVRHGPKMSADSFALLLHALYSPTSEASASVALELSEDQFDIRLEADGIRIKRGAGPTADVQLRGSVEAWWSLLFDNVDPGTLEADGSIDIIGDREVADRFLRSFPAPRTFAGVGARLDRAAS